MVGTLRIVYKFYKLYDRQAVVRIINSYRTSYKHFEEYINTL